MAEENQLAWQSAFWALVPIALNSVTLPSGPVLGLPSSWNFALRASPAFCALAAHFDMLSMVTAAMPDFSPSARSQRWHAMRRPEASNMRDGNFESLCKNRALTGLLFVFGALPQVIKVYATHHVPITQICFTAYLAAFFMDSLSLSEPREQGSQDSPGSRRERAVAREPRQDLSEYSTFVLGTSVAVLCMILVCVLCRPDKGYWIGGLPLNSIALPLAFLVPPLTAALLWLLNRKSPNAATKARALTTAAGFAMLILQATFSPLLHNHLNHLHSDGLVCSAAFILKGAAFVIARAYVENRLGSNETLSRRADLFLKTLFVSLHFFGIAICYRVYYDAGSTSRPEWTNWLG